MSLESTLERIAVALETIVVLQGGTAPAAKGPGRPAKATSAAPAAEVKVDAPKEVPAATAAAPAAGAQTPATPAATAPAAETPAAPAKSPKLQEVSKAINSLITGGHRVQAVALLQEYGAKNASGLKEPDYDAVLDKVANILLAA